MWLSVCCSTSATRLGPNYLRSYLNTTVFLLYYLRIIRMLSDVTEVCTYHLTTHFRPESRPPYPQPLVCLFACSHSLFPTDELYPSSVPRRCGSRSAAPHLLGGQARLTFVYILILLYSYCITFVLLVGALASLTRWKHLRPR